tara:strand:- start:214 stop:318 length:105 start_codon:yes stop_codon:yes gene_type:complete
MMLVVEVVEQLQQEIYLLMVKVDLEQQLQLQEVR